MTDQVQHYVKTDPIVAQQDQPPVHHSQPAEPKWKNYLIALLSVALVAALATLAATSNQAESSSTTSTTSRTDSAAEEAYVPLVDRELRCGLGELSGRLTSKTIYQNRIPLNDFTEEVSGQSLPTFLQEGTCELSRVYFLARHGTRFPTDGRMEDMQAFNFNLDMDPLDAGLLVPMGKEEQFSVGQRLRERYQNLTGQEITYHPVIYDFNSSAKTRALQSAEAFARGFFNEAGSESPILGDTPIVAIKSLDEDNDPYLRFHSACAKHEFEEDREDADSPQAHIDALGEKYKPILEEHFASLNIEGDMLEYATALFNACGLEQALGCVNLNDNVDYSDSACELINNETVLEILEYLADADGYYFFGLGSQINLDMSCVMRNEVIDFLDGLSAEFTETKFRFGFAHAETIMPLVAHLNLSFYQDSTEVLENNLYTVEKELFTEEVLDRNWRTSVHSPLATNLIFERYDCGGEQMLAVLHNELVVFEGTQAEFLEISGFYDDNCDFEAYCTVEE